MYPGKWAHNYPDKPAAIHATTGETLTYRDLNNRSNQLAQLMFRAGFRKEDHVAVFMENNLRYFEAVWAALRSGLYITPINCHLTAEEAGYILEDCKAQVLITSKQLGKVARSMTVFAPACRIRLMVDGVEDGFEAYEDAIERHPARGLSDQPAGQFMLYSSGTTGRPKGILRPLSGLRIDDTSSPIGWLQRSLWNFDQDTVYLSPAPLYHSAPIGFTTGTMALGGTIVMMPKFDEIASLGAIERFRVTHSQWVPTMFIRMLALPTDARTKFDLSSHKVAIHAAAPCPAGTKKQMLEWWGPIVHELYGGSEQNGLTHCTPEEWLERPGTVGKSILGTIHICDDDGTELPPGEPGLVFFELPSLPFKYHQDEAKTKSAQHPEHANWSALGDIGYVDDSGYLYLTDRATFMIISGGVNIYPQEIEDQLIMHPKVLDVAVIGVPDDQMGESVKAVVQPAHDVAPDEDLGVELLAYARQHLAHYKCPKSVDFVEALPRLPTGKLSKRLIRDQYWGGNESRIA